ncbi:MAG TPA: hypothetical protein VM915_15905 [Verrucomicrobiae bacterium]|nr:hypothetical protein [Verrucomicrobiae bacterium]
MRFHYNRLDRNLVDAVAYANSLERKDAFWDAIALRGGFDESALNGARIAALLRAPYPTVTVRLQIFPSLKTNAATDPNHPWQIFYARFKRGRSVASIVNTLVHEFVHNVDMFGDGARGIDFGHGNQSSVGKEETAPYWIGDLAERIYRAETGQAAEKDMEEAFEEDFSIDPAGTIPDDADLPQHD